MGRAPFVVAVSGTSGAGKSTVAGGMAAAAVSSGRRINVLHFDDYADAAGVPGDLEAWLERGADPDEWRTGQLEVDLRRLIDQSGPDTLILVEEPFGRARRQLRDLVDLAVHIDLPLEIALVRRLLRDLVPESGALDEQGVDRLRGYLARYLGGGGAAYRAVDRVARASADLVVDGSADHRELVRQVMREVERRQSAPP